MDTFLILSILAPLAGAVAIAVAGRADLARWIALASVLVALALAGYVVSEYPGGNEVFAATDISWLGGTGTGVDVRISLGLDGLSIWLYGLTALLMVTAVLVGWKAIDSAVPGYYALLLLLETGMLGVFSARDIILFYVFFEFTLIPLFFLIGIWGSEQRRYAATKFFLFTLAGSVLTFLGLLAIVWWNWTQTDQLTFAIDRLTSSLQLHSMPAEMQLWVFLALFAGFAIKVPLVPFHTWLPLAHVQAPTAGSVLLAGVLLKIGTYGFVRFSMPMLPEAVAICMPWILWLSVIGIIYGALVALAQADMKRLIAYSSVSHLGFCMLGLFALNRLGVQGSVLQMINHGLSTGGLFAVIGMLYERYHTRQIKDLSGIAVRTPILAFFMLLFTFSSIGLPGLNGFAGEILILTGMFQRAWAEAPAEHAMQLRVISVLAVLGVVLGAWYMLLLVQRVFFGKLKEPAEAAGHVHDLGGREVAALVPLAVFMVWIGLVPGFFLNKMAPTLDTITAAAARAENNTVVATAEHAKVMEVAGLPRTVPATIQRGDSSRVD